MPFNRAAFCFLIGALLTTSGSLRADHVRSDAYPYVAEIKLELLSQEKLYAAESGPRDLYNETTTTRIVLYKFWGSGILSSQNDPDDDDPHGPLRDVGLMVHEAGVNRAGVSTLEVVTKSGKPYLRLVQNTELVYRSGKRLRDVEYKAELPIRFWRGSVKDFRKRGRVTAELAEGGQPLLMKALNDMVKTIVRVRRDEINANLAENGLKLIDGTLTFKLSAIGGRKMKIVFDNNVKTAKLRLPDMRVEIRANVEQTYDSGSENSQ